MTTTKKTLESRTLSLATLSHAMLGGALLLAGCGGGSGSNPHVATSLRSTTAQPASHQTDAVTASTVAIVEHPVENTGDDVASLPPDVALAMLDTLVMPGQEVEIAVEGTSDVTGIVLSDGINSPEPFVQDASGNVWRASYRVPLRPKQERLALSVTARNAGSHWRRMWVFLNVQTPRVEVEYVEPADVDSTLEK